MYTLTADNGREFAGHRRIARELEADFFFTTLYHSRERGLNGHVDGLVLRYFPKGTNLPEVTVAQVRVIRNRLNR